MNRKTNNQVNHRSILHPFTLAILAVTLSAAAWASPCGGNFLTGVRNSAGPRRLSEQQLQQVRESLRRRSGFVELSFDQHGALTLGNRQHIAGGSATARALLVAAVDSPNLYELESHERSPQVAFARIEDSTDRLCVEDGKRTIAYRVQLDFADFNYLSGSTEAKAAFDLGIALLHELVHGVMKLQDPHDGSDAIGDCDAHVNQMRRELGLPERSSYYPGITVLRFANERRIVVARLEFVERQNVQSRPSAKYQLCWLPHLISPQAQNIAGFEQGLVVAKRR